MREPDKDNNTWVDFFADLISGRMHNSLWDLHTKQLDLEGQIEEYENRMTPTEQKIINAAQSITQTGESLKSAMDTLKEKVSTLTAQAQSSIPVANPENLDEEFSILDQAIAGLSSIGTQLETSPVESGSSESPVALPADIPVTGATPLAGATGPTDGVPTAVQPSPGSGTGLEDPLVVNAEAGNEVTEDGVWIGEYPPLEGQMQEPVKDEPVFNNAGGDTSENVNTGNSGIIDETIGKDDDDL